jgi:tetratricopeptide (TPR) repeat protein
LLALTGAVFGVLHFSRSRHDEPLPGGAERASSPLRAEVTVELPTVRASASAEQLRKESEQVITELMRRRPDSPGALHIAATYYAEVKQHAKASEIWERCISLAPSYAGPRVGLATAAMERGDDERGIAILQDALDAGCRTADVYYHLANALQKVGRLEQAEAAVGPGLEAFPADADLWISLGQIQLQQGRLREANASLKEAVRLRPDAADAHFALVTVHARLGESDRAAEHRVRFETLKSENPLAKHRFQEVYDAVLRHIVIRTLGKAAAEHQRQGDVQEAERLYLRALELHPRAADVCRWLTSLYHSQGRIGDAHLVQQRLVAVEPDRAENYLNLASLALQLGRLDEAEAILLDAARAAPGSPAAYAALARLYLQLGRDQEARAMADQAARLKPSAGAP